MSFNATVAIDTTKRGSVYYPFGQCNRLWLPKKVVVGQRVEPNLATDTILGIRIGDQTQDMHPWSIADGFATSASGPMDGLWVTVLQKGAADVVYLCTGTNVGLGYGDIDGLSAVVADGAGTQGSTREASNIRVTPVRGGVAL